jgi:eukaryotic-like serine/threonine-protein kinase
MSPASAASASARDLLMPRLSPPEPMFDPMASFGQGMLARKQSGANNKLFLAIGGAALAVAAVVVVIAVTGGDKQAKPAAVADNAIRINAPVVPAGDPNTGFDLYVTPSGTMTWRLDGEARTDRLPSRIRGITPGKHTVAIDAPPGFIGQNVPVEVELGKAPKVEIVLQPLDIAGAFESSPAGATVSLIVDGKREPLGASPARSRLDPRKTYQVLFEKPGYVSVNRPIVFTGSLEEKVAVTLEKAGGSSATAIAAADPTPKVETPKVETPKVEKKPTTPATPTGAGPVTRPDKGTTTAKVETPKVEKPEIKEAVADAKTGGTGTLLLGSKPPCEIYIDGKATGLSTPQKDLKLSAGKHKITLVNNEYGIKETFSVDIKADAVEKQIKDYSDRLPK